MAFESVAGLASFDLTAGQRVPAVSPILYDLITQERDRVFLSRISDGPTVDEVKFSWWNRNQRPLTVTAAEALTDVELDLDVTAGHEGRLVIGAILMDENAPKERIQVTDIVGSTLTITRAYGGTPAEAHADATTFRIVSMPAQEDSTTGLDLLRHPSEVINYTEIKRRDLRASRSSQGVKTYSGYTLNARRLQEKMVEIRDELEQIALFGVPNSVTPVGSDTQLRTTGGLLHFATNVDDVVRSGLDPQDIKDLLDDTAKELMENGTDPNFVLAGGSLFGAINDLDEEKMRLTMNDGVRGFTVKAIRTKFGPILDLVYDRWFPATYLCVGDYRKIQQRLFSNGGNPHIEQLAKVSDGDRMMIVGELGYQVENGDEAFKVYRAVTAA